VGKSITRAIRRGRPWNLRSLPFQGPKSLDFQSPHLPLALEMDLPALKSLRPAPRKQQVQVVNLGLYLITVLILQATCPSLELTRAEIGLKLKYQLQTAYNH
jgi:hypothetical protein